MVASLLRVLHGGIQDSRLLPPKGKPNVELYSKVLIRAGRFTTQWVRLDFDTRPAFGTKSVLRIPRKGHLVARLYLVTTMPDIDTVQVMAREAAAAAGKPFAGPKFTWTNSLGHALIQQANVDIGGARVEQIDGQLLEVLDEFYTPLEKVELANRLLKRNSTNFPQFAAADTGVIAPPTVAITPLPFWFSRGDPGVYLPIDALSADPVKITITFAAFNSLYVSSAQVPVPQGANPLGGSAYYPLENSPFYVEDPTGPLVYGLQGNPLTAINTTQLPVKMSNSFVPADTYVMAEYVYLDAPEANKFRISDIEIPVTQHYAFEPYDTKQSARATIPLKIPNPTRNLFFYARRFEAANYNATFLATRDLSGANTTTPWWPDAAPINARAPAHIRPAFVFRDSEPLASIMLQYEGSYVRYDTIAPSIFRSLVPSYEMKKSPFVNRYYYSLHFGLNHGGLSHSQPCGEANLDKIISIKLQLEFKPYRGCKDPNAVPRYIIYSWAQTYNIFRVYGGRGGLLFGY